ncbi:MAG: adenine phosphoribosyltransferase, partial [candidate division WOR-3 bacterium]
GFIFGIAIANKYNKGFIPIRKKGKLPYKTFEETYTLEYGTATIEMHTDAVSKGENILLVDDLLATGGTMKAATKLIEKSGGNVSGISFLIELDFLNGRKNLENWQISSIIHF